MPADAPTSGKSAIDEEDRLRELLKLKRDRRKMQDPENKRSEKDAAISKKAAPSNSDSSNNNTSAVNKSYNDNDTMKKGNEDDKSNEKADAEAEKNSNGKKGRRRRRGGRRRNRNRDRRRRKDRDAATEMNNIPVPYGGQHNEGDRWYRGGDPRDFYGGPGFRGGPPRGNPYYYDDREYRGGYGGYGPPPPDYRGGYGGRYDRFADDHYQGRRRDDHYWEEGRHREGRHGRDWRRPSRSRSRSRTRSLSRSSRSRSLSNSSSASYSPSRSRSRSRSNSRSASAERSSKERSSNDKKLDKERETDNERKEERRRSRSRSRSVDKKNSSNKRKKSDADYDRSNNWDKDRNRRKDRSRWRHRSRSRSNSTSRPNDQDEKKPEERDSKEKSKKSEKEREDAALTKDQRTIFVSQLVMRADERDIRRFFKRKAGCKVNDVILLRDRRTGRHKGCAYVELGRLEDVPKAVEYNSSVPDFQRFPILVRASEAEKNYDETGKPSTDTGGIEVDGLSDLHASSANNSNISNIAAALTASAQMKRRVEAQNIYVGSIDRCVTQAQLYAVFSQFGKLENVGLQTDPTTGMSRGFAFLSYPDAKDANLAIQTMSGQKLAGRPLVK